MELNQIAFRVEENYFKMFYETQKLRNIRKSVDYFRLLIMNDRKDFSNEKSSDKKQIQLMRNLNDSLELIKESILSQQQKSLDSDLKTEFKIQEEILSKILSLQIDPGEIEDNDFKSDEDLLGDYKAREMIDQIKMEVGE